MEHVVTVYRTSIHAVEPMTAIERRTLGGVIGFIMGLALLGPFAAVAGALLGCAIFAFFG